MDEVRCKKCNKLLGKINPLVLKIHASVKEFDKNEGIYEIKCPRCGEMNTNKGDVKDEFYRRGTRNYKFYQ